MASPEGRRLFDMSLGRVTLAFVGAASKENLKRIQELHEAIEKLTPGMRTPYMFVSNQQQMKIMVRIFLQMHILNLGQ